MRLRLLLAVSCLLIFSTAATASASVLNTAAASLRTDPVYVDPNAQPSITPDEANNLRQAIRSGSHPMFVAILPRAVGPEVGNNPNLLATALGHATGIAGTYAVVAGRHFRATSSDVSGAGSLATESFQRHSSEGVYAVLNDYVNRIEHLSTAGAGSTSSIQTAPHKRVSVGIILLIVLAGLMLVAGMALLVRRRMRFVADKEGLGQDIEDLDNRAADLVINEDDHWFTYAYQGRGLLIQAKKALKDARNHYDLDNVKTLVKKATDNVEKAERLKAGHSTFSQPDQVSDLKEESSLFHRHPSSASNIRRSAATRAPRGRIASSQRPRPAMVVNNINIPGGYAYNYPQYGGWGYWDPYGSFVPYMLGMEMMEEVMEPGDSFDWDDHSNNVDFSGNTGGGDFDGSDQGNYSSVSGGDFGSSGTDSGSGSDSGWSGGFDSGGGDFDGGGGGF